MGLALQRQAFQTSRLLEYFSEKELTLQTGHDPDRWPEVVLKELLDNALDACESHDIRPEIQVTIGDGTIRVEDNGPGLSPDVVAGVLDFGVRISSKDAYVSPTRGAQGNALKTLLAIPFVLSDGEPDPVIITSQGLRHTITVALDDIAQIPHIQHDATTATVRNGTCVEVPVGTLKTDEPDRWYLLPILAYSLLNPHATIKLTETEQVHAFSRTTDTWTKWRPSDPTSPHWYTVDQFRNLVAAYIHAERHGGRALFVRDFIGEFRGLASTVKRAAVLDGLPLAGTHLHDLIGHTGSLDTALLAELLTRMQAASHAVKPTALGVLGEDHVRTWLEAHGGNVETVKYKRLADVDGETGLPFVVEVAFAACPQEADTPLTVITGLNFSPTLIDPFRSVRPGASLESLLESLYVSADDPVIVVVHLVAPGLRFTDRGKSSLDTPRAVGAAIVEAVTTVTKGWTALKKKELRDASRGRREREEFYRARAAEEWSVKEAAFHVMTEAYTKAAGQIGLALARMVFYAARPLMQALTDKPINSVYFTQNLLPSYQAEHPTETAGWDVVFDARGHLWEPHTDMQVDLGTIDVRRYLMDATTEALPAIQPPVGLSSTVRTTGPQHRYSTVLFVEKEGFLPLLTRARIAERYDLAIMSTKGMSSTAARTLMEGLAGQVRFLSLHDFDKAGFSIIGTLTRDTDRYRFRVRPDVVDLGLRLADVEAEGLEAESCSLGDDRYPAANLRLNGATEAEIEFLLANGGQRVELNAFTSDQFLAWLERKLEAAGVVKLLPDHETLTAAYRRAIYIHAMNRALADFHETALATAAAAAVPADLREAIAGELEEDDTLAWDEAVAALAEDQSC